MSDATQPPDDSVSEAQQIDRLCDAFEAAWKSGPRPRLEELLDRAPAGQRERLLRELLPIDIHYRVSHGEQPTADDYLARFPSLGTAWIEQVIAPDAPQLTAAFEPAFRPDVTIAGRYVLKQKLGEGGMGEVWVAKQTAPIKRNVAIKLIKTGMDSRAVLARFEAERQALALMDHPHIARVLDGGITASGQPFFVMELVNGLPLNKFCDEARLTLQQRLELFVPICQAVQHAHHKGIVHRDLKPSNILVTLIDGRPVPKVIDFGVAKATAGKLTDESLETQFGAVVGTLEYMSPEQAGYSGADIDTRADIYSLGVILYELLTGLRPIDAQRLKQAAYTEMIRIIKEEEPSKPSTRLSTDESLPSLAALRQTEPRKLMAILRGELDWVVMKCLEKDRNRRYETANSLARDIEHYLSDEPVEARPPSTTYRLSKFLHRNKRPVLAASLLLLALVSGIVGTTWGMVQARNHRVLADKQRALAEQAAEGERDARQAETSQKLEAQKQADIAKQQTTIAQEQTNAAQKQFRVAMANQLAAQSHVVREEFPERSALLAVEAVNVTRQHGEPIVPLAEEELRGALSAIGGQVLLRDMAAIDSPGASEASSRATSASRTIALSPDGRWLAVGRADRTVKLWELTDEVARTTPIVLPGLEQPVLQLAFCDDGRSLAGVCRDQTAVWDLTTKSPPAPPVILPVSKNAYGNSPIMAMSPSGRWIASAPNPGPQRIIPGAYSAKQVQLWDSSAKGSEATLLTLANAGDAMAFSPDGRWLAFGMTLCDVTAQEPAVATISLGQSTNLALSARQRAVRFSPDGRWLASGTEDGTLRLWDVTSKDFGGAAAVVLPGRHRGAIIAVAFSSDGKLLATGSSDHTAQVWDLTTKDSGAPPLVFRGHEADVAAVAFVQNTHWLVSASRDGCVRRWDAARQPDLLPIELPMPSSYAFPEFSADGHWLAMGRPVPPGTPEPSSARLWDLTRSDPAASPVTLRGEDDAQLVAFSSDSRWLATSFGGSRGTSAQSDRSATLWDLKAQIPGEVSKVLRGYQHLISARDIGFSPDGRWLATSFGGSAGVILQDLAAMEPEPVFMGFRTPVSKVLFSPDSRWLATVANGGPFPTTRDQLALWNLASKDLKTPTLDSNATYLQFSPSGRWLATVTLGSALPTQPNDPRIGTAPNSDPTVRLWDLATKETFENPLALGGYETLTELREISRVPGVSFRVPSPFQIVFSPNNRWLATPGADNTVWLWDMKSEPPASERVVLQGQNARANQLRFSPRGRWLATVSAGASAGDTVRLWDVSAAIPSRPTHVFREIQGMDFSPDDHLLALGSLDGTVAIWDVSGPTPQFESATPQLRENGISGLAFSPDGRWLLVTRRGQRSLSVSMQLWPVHVDKLYELARDVTSRNLTVDEKTQYGLNLLQSSTIEPPKLAAQSTKPDAQPSKSPAVVAQEPVAVKELVPPKASIAAAPSKSLPPLASPRSFGDREALPASGTRRPTMTGPMLELARGETTPLGRGGNVGMAALGDGIRYTVYGCMEFAHERLAVEVWRVINPHDNMINYQFSGRFGLPYVEDLNLTLEQKEAINNQFDRLIAPSAYSRLGESPGEGRQNISEQLTKDQIAKGLAADAELKSILTDDQYMRAEQLMLQRLGPLALLRGDVAAKLNFSAEQRARVADIQEAFDRQRQAASAKREIDQQQALARGAIAFPAMTEEQQRQQKEAEARLLAVPTPDQQESWSAWLGPPVVMKTFTHQVKERREFSPPYFTIRPAGVVQALALGNPQAELKLTVEQQSQLNTLANSCLVTLSAFRQMLTKLEKLPRDQQLNSLEGTKTELSEKWAAADLKLKELEVLTPEQSNRAEQIFLHSAGPSAFARDDVASTLQLSVEQRAQIAKLTEDYQQNWSYLTDEQGKRQQAYEFNLMSVITPEQKATWDARLGPPPVVPPFPKQGLSPLDRRPPQASNLGTKGTFGPGGPPGFGPFGGPPSATNLPPGFSAKKSIADYDKAIEQDPTASINFHNRGTAHERNGDIAKAIADFTKAIRLQPKNPLALNALARLLATSSDDELRNGKKAVELATAACEISQWTFPAHLDTLAAAHAEAGDFEQAVKSATKASEMAMGSRKVAYKARLELYQSGKPYRTSNQ